MRYSKLIIDDKEYKIESQIIKILKSKELYWLIDSEVENAVVEIKNNTVIWHQGNYYSGNWYYGIFKGGDFYGKWENGIFENGNFKGKWESGINLASGIKK